MPGLNPPDASSIPSGEDENVSRWGQITPRVGRRGQNGPSWEALMSIKDLASMLSDLDSDLAPQLALGKPLPSLGSNFIIKN